MTGSPSSWSTVSLGEICTFNYGKALPESSRAGGEIPVYGSNGIVGFHNSAKTSGRTIVIGRKGSFGEVNYSAMPCWPIDTAYFVDEASTKADIRWLSYRLAALGLNKLNKAAAVPGLNREDAYRQQLLLPPLPEQRRIAAILDQADTLRAKRREALAQLDSLTQSFLSELLRNSKSLSKVPLEKLVLDMHQGINTVTEDINYKPAGFPIIQSKHTTQGYLDLNDARFVDAQTFEQYRDKYKPRKNNLLLCNIGTIGSSIIVKEEIDFLVAWNLFLIKVKADVAEPVYIKAFLDQLFHAHYFDKFLTGGTVKFISKKTLSETPISLPIIEEQREFVGRIDRVERLKCSHLNALSQLDALFASLQHRAFQGAL